MPRQNKLKALLSEGRVAFGGGCHIGSGLVVDLMGKAGYDFVMIDTEHGTYDIDTAGELIRAAHGSGMTPLVRVLDNDRGLIMKALDLGAHGVIIPHVRTRSEAEAAVSAAKYHPEGSRGSCPIIAAADYTFFDWSEYQDWANKETMVIVLIEDPDGVKNIDEILSVSGIDVVMIGPFDMSVTMGLHGEATHPSVQANVDRVLAAARAKNLPAMHALLYPTDVDAWIAKGVRIFAHASDLMILAEGSGSFLRSVEHVRRRPAAER